jgi:hypothetical protein
MRQLFIAAAALAALAGPGVAEARAEKWKVEGIHLCCRSCEKSVQAILDKVEGVSEVACDRSKQEVRFTAKDEKAAKSAYDKLLTGGFYGRASSDQGTAFATASASAGVKADQVTVKGVHVCCNSCKRGIEALFQGSKVSYAGDGPQRDVTISGRNLDPAAVMDTLRGAGFNGTLK